MPLFKTIILLLKKLNQLLILSIISIFILSSSVLHSQQSKVYFHELSINGIPFNYGVNVLFHDQIGFLWIGTENGLFRYDGYNLIHYENDVFNKNSIPNNSVRSIIEDDNHNLWIGCESYLAFFNRKENTFKSFYKNSQNTVLFKSSEGAVWVNHQRTGLIKITPHQQINSVKFTTDFNFNNDNKLIDYDKQILSLVQDKFNRIWVTTNNGIFGLDENYNFIQTNFNEKIIKIITTENNKFVALTDTDLFVLGYNKTNTQLEILESYPNFINNPKTTATSLSKNTNTNDFWVGTSFGLIKASRKNNKFLFTKNTTNNKRGELASNIISTTTFDDYGNLWVGTPKGINKLIDRASIFELNQLENYTTDFPNFSTHSINFESPNEILLGTSIGMIQYNTSTKTFLKIDTENIRISQIRPNYEKDKLLIARDNELFQSTTAKTVNNKLNTLKIKSYNNRITKIEVINKNEIWVGIWNDGLDIINNQDSLTEFKKLVLKKFQNKHTSILHLAKNNILWIGTRGEGLFKIDLTQEKIEEFLPSKENGLTSNAILSLLEDSNNNIWVGTRGGGLNLYNEKNNKFTSFGLNNTLISKTISGIEQDLYQNLWLSTSNGIVKFNPIKEKFDAFGIEDGIIESQFQFSSSAISFDNKRLFFGCPNGFYTIYPDKHSPKEIIPSTVITSFAVLPSFNTETDAPNKGISNELDIYSGNKIVLPYNENNISIEFSSLDLTAPNKNEYAYILDGINNYWVYTTSINRNVTFNDLSPGDYTFKVKSSNSNGIWNETPKTISFTITPPFWKTNLAFFIYFILGFLLIAISIIIIKRWYELKQNLIKETISHEKENQLNKMKMVFFTDISHELRTPLTLILGTIEKIIKEKNFTLSAISSQRILNNSLRMKRLINQIMDFRKFDVGKFKIKVTNNIIITDIKKIKNAFNDYAKISSIKFSLIVQNKGFEAWYDIEILEKILFNLLSNAFKYTSEKGEITLNAKIVSKDEVDFNTFNLKKGNYLVCSVHDTGVGIPKEDLAFIFDRYYQSTKLKTNQVPGTGIGMELVSKLIEKHKGEITVESEENIFTEFKFYLPVNQTHYSTEELLLDSKKQFKDLHEYHIIEGINTEFEPQKKLTNSGKSSIIIIEDNVELRTMIKENLINEFNVFEASNGEDGYNQILEKKPHLIISDIRMPIENGVSMLKRIKANPEINHIPIFMLTAKDLDEVKMECLSLGADDFIEKPFSLQYLLYKVKNTLVTRKHLKEKYSKVISAEPSELKLESNDEKFVKKLIVIIENAIDDQLLSVEYLASEVGMSRANLYRKLLAITNDTPVNFIKKIRLKRAQQLLKKNDLYISEIAYMCGFSNQKYFGKCFQKEFGMSPTGYIKKHACKDKKSEININLDINA